MCLFVTGVGTLIHVYAVGYMHGDPKFSKFFCYLNLFAFSMLVLVLGENMVVTFLGWEGVGTCSYLLISFWHTRAVGGDGRQEGVHHQPGRRLGLHGGDVPRLRRRRVAELRHRQRRGDPGRPRHVDGDGDRRDAVHRRRRQERPAPAVPLAPRRDGGPDAGVGADPCRDDGDRRGVPDGARQPGAQRRRRLGADDDRLDRRRHGAVRRDRRRSPRTTSRRCSPTRRSASSATCSSPSGPAPTWRRSST